MSPQIATVLAAAESLSADERRELIELLSAGLDDSVPTGTEAWRREVVQRSAEYDAGIAEAIPWTNATALARYVGRRRPDRPRR